MFLGTQGVTIGQYDLDAALKQLTSRYEPEDAEASFYAQFGHRQAFFAELLNSNAFAVQEVLPRLATVHQVLALLLF